MYHYWSKEMISIFSKLLLANSIFKRSEAMATTAVIKKVPEIKLGQSEPPPEWFGNSDNPTNNKFWTNKNWLKSRFHFSFAEYNNHLNQNFGILRVMNDDLVQPSRGFGSHPHRNAEICTYVVEGELTHKDSMGTKETITRGAIQFMTAGSGIVHSEHNLNEEKPLRFIQMWITPKRDNLKPNYGSFSGDLTHRQNKWFHMVADNVVDDSTCSAPIKIAQDCNIYVTELDPSRSLSLTLRSARQAYVLCIEGEVDLHIEGNDSTKVSLSQHDAAEVFITEESSLTAIAGNNKAAHILLVEMSFTGRGRGDL